MTQSTTGAAAPAIPRIDEHATLNDILRDHPHAVEVMNAFGLDACCGGARSLADAAREDGADLAALLAALEWDSCDQESADPESAA